MTPPLKVKVVSTNLKKKGFRTEQGDHERFIFYYEGKKTAIRTKISHGEKEIGIHLVKKMANQLHLEKEEFVKFALCDISEKEYIAILHEKMIL